MKYIGKLADAPAELRVRYGNGADDDILISNGRITAVFSALGSPTDLAPTGGNLIDFGIAGGVDDMTLTYQIAGILPDDAFAYRTIDLASDADSVSVTVRGTLDGRSDVKVVTHYVLVGCEARLRVRSELFNGSPDKQAFFIADGMHWGKRRVVPFAPARGQGFSQPELELLELSSQWSPMDFAAGVTPSSDAASYAAMACSADRLHGVNDLEISALGTPIEYVAPGDSLVLERMLFVAASQRGVAPVVDDVVAARAQQFGDPTQTITGRIVAGGLPFGGDVRRASIVIRSGDRALTSVVPDADGKFVATVAATGDVTADVWSFGRKVSEKTGTALGDIEVPEPATVQLSVERIIGTKREPAWALVVFAPDDEPTRAAVTGTFHGRLTECAPWLGPPHGASPACDHVIVAPQGTDVEVPAGNYVVIASAGPEHTIDIEHVQLAAGDIVPVAIDIEKLDLVPPGWISADLHVHGRASFDSGFPDEDRVRSFVAAGVEVIAATDHDVIGDYTSTVASLGLDDRVAVMGGLETTQLIPWLDVEGESVPRVIGHFNFWPLIRDPSAPRAGAPWDELIEPGSLFDRMAPLVGDGGMMMLNHPWGDPLFGRDIGYLRAIKLDPRVPIGARSPLMKRPDGQHRNMDWSIIEIINGGDMSELMQARTLWHSLLAQGYLAPGAGNSDSHGMTDDQLGWARNWVQAPTQVIGFDPNVLNAAIRDGRMIAGNGVVVLVEVGPPGGPRRGLGFTPYQPKPGDVIDITVKAAPWIPLHEVRIVTSKGTQVIASIPRAANPFGTDVVRYQGQLPIAQLVDRDDFVIVEAGLAYPLAADLDDDGVLDTTDNNGDGVVDEADVDEDEDVGPLKSPADPTAADDQRFLITRIVRGAWPEGFANPIFIDLDGNGWTPPGLPK
ncbi:MAG TPA: CehA/McbA family metallohydrolase [Kofleriaceae bacterium]